MSTTSPCPREPFPYRVALAGGWIDQPFVSRLNPAPPGSMVVVNIHATHAFMERAGMATGSRKVALRLWPDGAPRGAASELVRTLYAEENRNLAEPSGSQDMIGLLYPGINRLDYDYAHEGGVFPRHIESHNDPVTAAWLERVLHLVPVAPRPDGYNPLGVKKLEPRRVHELGQTGKDCFDAIVHRDIAALGQSMNRCMECWAALLPHVVEHPTIAMDLMAVLRQYQSRYAGAMYSGCGGGYLYIASEESVPGALKVKIRLAKDAC